MTKFARATLDALVKGINGETVIVFLRRRLFSDEADIPSRKWSLLNQFTLVLAATSDARGIRQWETAGRTIKKDAKAFYILVPLFINPKTTKDRKIPKDSDNNNTHLVTENTNQESDPFSFKCMPVFRVEDTEGNPLPYELILKAFDPLKLPLIEVAKSLGITVQTALMQNAYGSFNRTKKEIRLGTDDPLVFLHELSHAVDNELSAKSPSYAFNEVVAELSAAFLGSLYGYPPSLSDTRAYIETYTGRGRVAFTIAKALSRVEKIYSFIKKQENITKTKVVRFEKPLDLFSNSAPERNVS